MDIEDCFPEFEKLFISYREAYILPIESILNSEKDTTKAMSKIAEVKISQIAQIGHSRLTEIEDLLRNIVYEVLVRQHVENAKSKSSVIIPRGWLASELSVDTFTIMSLIGSYIETCIEVNAIIKNNSGLSIFFKGLLNGKNSPGKSFLGLFGESSAETNLKKLGSRLDLNGTQLYLQLKIALEKMGSLVSEKMEIEVVDL